LGGPVNLHAYAQKGDVITTVPNGTAVLALGYKDGWVQVQYGSLVGYIDPYYLTESYAVDTVETPANEAQSEWSRAYKIYGGENTDVSTPEGGALNLHAHAKTGEVITTIPNGTTLKALGYQDGWVKVKYGGVVGYVDPYYLTESYK